MSWRICFRAIEAVASFFGALQKLLCCTIFLAFRSVARPFFHAEGFALYSLNGLIGWIPFFCFTLFVLVYKKTVGWRFV
jgi:hypothetical protein